MLTPLFFRFNAVNAAIFPVKRRDCRFFPFNAANAAILPVQRR